MITMDCIVSTIGCDEKQYRSGAGEAVTLDFSVQSIRLGVLVSLLLGQIQALSTTQENGKVRFLNKSYLPYNNKYGSNKYGSTAGRLYL